MVPIMCLLIYHMLHFNSLPLFFVNFCLIYTFRFCFSTFYFLFFLLSKYKCKGCNTFSIFISCIIIPFLVQHFYTFYFTLSYIFLMWVLSCCYFLTPGANSYLLSRCSLLLPHSRLFQPLHGPE